MKDLRVQLKICEGCGALWLRAEVTGGVYCSRCAVVLAEFPSVGGHRRARRPQVRRQASIRTDLQLVRGAR
jgi:hypothetical protein